MKIAIGMTVWDRHEYLRSTLEGWSRVRFPPEHEFTFTALVEPTRQVERVKKLIVNSGVPINIVVNPKPYGCTKNTHAVLQRCYEQLPDFIVMAEEDTVPAPDALEFLIWAAQTQNSPSVFCVCCATDSPPTWTDEEVSQAYLRDWFNPWIWGIWPDRVPDCLDRWDFDYTYDGWDHNFNWRLRRGLCVFPTIGRQRNIGQVGVHSTAAYPLWDTALPDYQGPYYMRQNPDLASSVHEGDRRREDMARRELEACASRS